MIGFGETYWLLPCVCEGVWVGVDGLTLDLVGPSTVVPQAGEGSSHITLGHGDGLSVVERLDGSQLVEVGLHQLGQLDQQLATVLRCNLAPWAIKGLPRGGDGNVDILLSGLGNGADDLLSGGVDDLEGLLVYALDELIVDETEEESQLTAMMH